MKGGSSGSAYSGSGLSSFGSAMNAPIGGLGGVPGTSAYAGWGGGAAGLPTYGGGYIGSVGDSRTFSALNPRSQAYMQAGSPDSYATWLQRGGGMQGGGQQDQLQQLLSTLFQQQQQQPRRPDYSQLFANSQVNLEGPMMSAPPQLQSGYNTFSNKPSFGNINPYA